MVIEPCGESVESSRPHCLAAAGTAYSLRSVTVPAAAKQWDTLHFSASATASAGRPHP